jgi:hypothetical protein
VEFVQGELLGLELAVDAEDVLHAAADFPLQAVLRQFILEELANFLDVFLPLPFFRAKPSWICL